MVRGAPLFPCWGEAAPGVKWAAHHFTTPPPLPVPPPVQLKFPRVINSDSPLNDSRQLDWVPPQQKVSVPGVFEPTPYLTLAF